MALKNGSGVTIIRAPKGKDSLEELSKALLLLADVEVLVGVPDETTDQHPNRDALALANKEEPSPMTNAELAYIQDNGAPEVGIPARSFMLPGIARVQSKIASQLRKGATVAFNGGSTDAVEATMHTVGLTAQLSIQKMIQEGIPPPLADSTLRARARKKGRGKGRIGPGIELLSRSQGYAPSNDFVTPLYETGDLVKSITYAIRSRKKRGK